MKSRSEQPNINITFHTFGGVDSENTRDSLLIDRINNE
jgi:hypothetical protein